jgi:hypothetical protein
MRDIICIGLFFAFDDNLNLCASVKDCEIIADNLSKAGGVGAAFQPVTQWVPRPLRHIPRARARSSGG